MQIDGNYYLAGPSWRGWTLDIALRAFGVTIRTQDGAELDYLVFWISRSHILEIVELARKISRSLAFKPRSSPNKNTMFVDRGSIIF
ncbi:hypothetical protein [Bifidobacterium callitrichos]|uniref:hypothetical protein n=1 Tax=Bifidobacterium callitrichos TaxID=762209 RepID=UPI0021594223|nr:hypothetical protein [Bifidobacterium callitrichos]